MRAEFDFVASIGPNCRASWNTQDFFGDFTTRPFDWWITPFHSALALLKSREAPEFRPEDFQQLMITDRDDTIYNSRLNVYHHHDFSRGPDGLSVPNWRDAIPAVSRKYTYLFERFWRDFNAAKNPLLVLGGLLTFRDTPHFVRNNMQAADFDIGSPPMSDAAGMIRDIFPERPLTVLLVFPGSINIIKDRDGALLYTGIDDGSRPAYLTPNAWQHPTNVFRDGFNHFGMKLAEHIAGDGNVSSDSVLAQEPYRLMRAGSLHEKARLALSGANADSYLGKKYLLAAFQLNPGPALKSDITATAAEFGIDLLAESTAATIDLSVSI